MIGAVPPWRIAACALRRTAAAGAIAAGACAVLGGSSAAAAPAVRGLVIGIDDYAHLPVLHGAVNDAEDIRKALSETGVDDLTVLIDAAATRDRIVAEWRSLVSRAEPGDTLVLTYAGHGGQERERVRGSESDGRDEVLLLGGFRSAGKGTRERIIDDEIHHWLVQAGKQRLRVVFVADACHSGTLTRKVDPRAPVVTYRYTRHDLEEDLLELDLPDEAVDHDDMGEGELAHVNFLGAAQEHQKVPEITVRDAAGRPERRGALSYLFARALRGEADTDGNGVLRRDELWRFVRENVRMNSAARQTPNLMPNTRGDETVLVLAPGAAGTLAGAPGTVDASGVSEDAAAAEPSQGRAHRIRLAVRPANAAVAGQVRDALPHIRLVSDESESPDLVWDTDRRQVVSAMGDVVAHDVSVSELAGVVEKSEAVRAIRTLSARASLRLRIEPHDGVHREGSRIGLRVDGREHPRLTVFSLSGNGAVHYLYPGPNDPTELPVGKAFELDDVVVTKPFGADHVVAVSAATSLAAFNAALRRLDCRRMPCPPAADRAAALLAETAAGASGWSSGILGLYTEPREGDP